MMRLTRTAIGLLTAQYRSVLRKCFLINVGLYALLAPAASLTTATAVAVTAMPNSAEAALINVGPTETVDDLDGRYTNNGDITIENRGTINNITGTIINSYRAYWGAGIWTWNNGGPGLIKNIAARIINNRSEAIDSWDLDTSGAGIEIASAGKIDKIKNSIFIGNNVYNTYGSGFNRGGAIVNENGTIGEISDTLFFGNYVLNTDGGTSLGGAIYNINGDMNSISGTYINNYVQANSGDAQGGAIGNNKDIGSIGAANDKALFIGNYAQSTSGKVHGGAIYNSGTISGDINADFIGNHAEQHQATFSSQNSNWGGAIYNAGDMGNISGNFINNGITTTGGDYQSLGGAIANHHKDNGELSSIKTISGIFIGNYVNTNHGAGGAITNYKGKIAAIDADFIGNTVHNQNVGYSEGGAISSGGTGSAIGSIKGSFINNLAETSSTSEVSTSNEGVGGAINNGYDSAITSIEADFIGNKASSTSSVAKGGAISNDYTISNITADFINNSATSESGAAQGGAIYNTGTISSLDANFINNSATSTSSEARGGAIYNTGSMSAAGSSFIGNMVAWSGQGNNSFGSAIYNAGNMLVKDTVFKSNTGQAGTIWNSVGTIEITNSIFANNTATVHGSSLYNDAAAGSATLIDTSILNNNDGQAATLIDRKSLHLVARNKDVELYNKVGADVLITSESSGATLNAAAGKEIRINGDAENNSTLDINKSGVQYTRLKSDMSGTETATINDVGGDYVFNSELRRDASAEGAINLYNDANVRFGNVRQSDGTETYGHLNVAATTIGEAGKTENNGATMNFANANADQTQNFGALTLNGNLKLGLDSGEKIAASSATGEGSILIDYINYASTPAGNQISWTYADSGNAIIGKVAANSTATVNTPYQTFTGAAVKSGNVMNVTLSDGTENLAGFLTQNATGTSYDMARDEQILVDLDEGGRTMAGTTKTVNANGHNIIGNQHAGVTLAAGQTLTINDANVEGFYGENGSAIRANPNSKVNINNSVFRNNTETNSGILYSAYSNLNIDDSSFYNNVSFGNNYETAVIHKSGGIVNINAKTKDSIFEGNSGMEGSVIRLTNSATANITGENGHKVIFSNNTASDNGGVITLTPNNFLNASNAEFLYNSAVAGGAINIQNLSSRANISDALFKGNEAKSSGGAITNSGTLSVENSTFENNTATESGGAIYNAGTIGTMADVPHETYTIKQHVVTNSDTNAKLTYYDAADVTAINNIIAQNKKVQILTQEVTESKTDAQYQALQAAIAADTTHTTYAEKNPKLLVSIDNYYMPTSGGIQNTTFEGNYITANSTNDVMGGAIYNAESGYMNIEGGKFKNNLITQDGTGKAYGAGIYNAGVINNLNADFEENKGIGKLVGTAIRNTGVINNITGKFVENIGDYNGAAISSSGGYINSINADFTNNLVNTTQHGRGGAIDFREGGKLGSVSGTFENNGIITNDDMQLIGGAINISMSEVGSISGSFINNYLLSTNSTNWSSAGGAIYLEAGTNVGTLSGEFSGNYVLVDGVGSAKGGAIGVSDYLEGTRIGQITDATFANNYAIASGSGQAQGGAIVNQKTITSIGTSDNHVKFEGNYAQANTGNAYGGAIYNSGTIDNIYADFTNNKAESVSGEASGGAIYNAGNIKITDSNFIGNYVSSGGPSQLYGWGGAIFNSGKMKIIANDTDSTFKNNRTDSTVVSNATDGGAIGNYNGTLSIEGKNGHKVIFTGNYSADDGGAIYNNSVATIKNAEFINNIGADHTYATLFNQGQLTLVDTNFIGNTSYHHSGGISNYITTNIVADSNDVIFKGNKKLATAGEANEGYSDISNWQAGAIINLNADSDKSIDFGGSVTGSGTLNINKSGLTYTDLKDDGTFETETKNITQTGGDYIFRNEVSGQTMNLYDGANVQLRQLKQADGTTSYGNLSLTGFTSTGAGNILDTGNARVDTSGQLALGTTTLNANTNLRLDVNLANATASAGDLLSGTWSSGSGNFVIDSINILGTGATTQALINNDTLKSHIAMASTYHTFEQDYKDRYTVTYSNGYLNFNQNQTGTLNLVGYLSNASSTATTPYDMTSDEPVLRAIGAMTGTTKTVNAGNYTISGNGYSGVTVGANQTLNINGGVWDGFTQNVMWTDGKNEININNAKFVNNKSTGSTGLVIDTSNSYISEGFDKINITDSEISNNDAIYYVLNLASDENKITADQSNVIFTNNKSGGGVIASPQLTLEAKNKDIIFENNTGRAIYNYYRENSSSTISATGGDVIFKNNTAGTGGGAIYNAGTLAINSTATHRAKFENNESFGGTVFNNKTITNLDADFTGNNAKYRGGALWSYGSTTNHATIGTINGEYKDNYLTNDSLSQGGAIFLESTDVTSISGKFENNYVTGSQDLGGGAIYSFLGSIGTITADFINNGSIGDDNNTRANRGGAISNDSASLTTIGATDDNVLFQGNKVTSNVFYGSGGAIESGGEITNIYADFTGNYVSSALKAQGGGIQNGGIISKIGASDHKSTFTGNYVETSGTNAYGGGIANNKSIGTINADFTGNYAKSTGEFKDGAGSWYSISGDTADNPGSGRAYGGAIFNLGGPAEITSIAGNFIDNYVYSENGYANGSAIYNEYSTIGSILGGNDFEVTLADGTTKNINGFYRNKSTSNTHHAAGAIFNSFGSIDYIGSAEKEITFKDNKVETKGEGNSIGAALLNVNGTIQEIYASFEGNGAVSKNDVYGGAINTALNVAGTAKASINKIVGGFIDNYVEGSNTAFAGAILNAHGATIGEINADFTGNYAKSQDRQALGGAINNYGADSVYGLSTITTIKDSNFTNNYALAAKKAQGGAIWNHGTIGTLDPETSKLLADNTGIVDSTFTGNYVRGNDESTGGAIWNSGNINLSAFQSDVNFWNNKANDEYNDIYNSGIMNFNAAQNKTMSFGGSIEGSGAININTGATSGGTYVFKSGVSAGNVVVGSADSGYAPATLSFEKATQEDGSITNGTFDVASLTINGDGNSLSTRNDKVDTNSATTLTLNNALNMQIDGDLQSHTGDSIAVSNLTAAAPKSLRLTAMNFTTDPDVTTLSKTDTVDVNITGENDILAQNNAYTLASTNPDDTTEEQIEQAYLDNLTSSSRNYNKTYAFRSAKLMTSGNNQTYVQYGDAITLKWLYENYINGWSGGNYILNNVTDGGNPDSTHLTVGQALTALDSALGKNATYDFSTQSVADVLVNNYYTKLVKKDEKFDTNEGIMDVKNWKKDTNSSQGRIIKGVSAFPSNLCAYPFDMPQAANDNHKNVIVMSAFKPSSYGKRSATIGSRPNQFAEILVSSTRMTRKESTRMTRKESTRMTRKESTRMTRKESIKMTGNATTTKQAA